MSLSTVPPTASRPLSLTVTQTQTHHSQTARAHSSSLSERVSDALTNFNARPAPRHGAMARSPHSAPPMRGKIPLPTFSAADAAAALRSPPCHRAPCSHRRPSPGPHRRPRRFDQSRRRRRRSGRAERTCARSPTLVHPLSTSTFSGMAPLAAVVASTWRLSRGTLL